MTHPPAIDPPRARPARSRSPRAVLVGAGLAALLAAVVLVGLGRRGASPAPDARPPAPAGAHARGGVPAADPALDRALGPALTDHVVALDAWRQARARGRSSEAADEALDRTRRALLGRDVQRALGPAATAGLRAVLERAQAAAAASGDQVDDAADALTAAVLAFNDEAAAADLGYLLDNDVVSFGDDSGGFVLIFGFAIERVRVYRSGDAQVPVVHARRIDTVNWSHDLYGFTTRQRREAVLLLPQIEERLVEQVLPQLAAEPPPLYLLDDEDRDAPWAAPLAAAAADAIRAAYGADPDSRRLGELLARRKALVAGWNERLAPAGIALRPAGRLHLDLEQLAPLRGRVPAAEMTALAELEAALAAPALALAFDAARARLVRALEHHEGQHRLDADAPAPLAMPAALAEFVGPLHDDDGGEVPIAWRAQAELSAYLAEMARAPDTALVSLAHTARFLVEPAHWASAECFAAVVALEALAEILALPGQTLVRRGEIDRDAVAALYQEAAALGPERLAGAAATVWERLFGAPLPALVLAE